MRSLFSCLLCAVLVQACGLKGPLYLPTPAEKREMAEREKQLEERSEREKKEQQQQTSQPEQSQQQ
jgi:predicted small lipoprotein YifL